MTVAITHSQDAEVLRAYRRNIVSDWELARLSNLDTIIVSAEIAAEWFSPDQSDEERAATKRYLVAHELASWMYPR